MDLKVTKPGEGWLYFPDHLPILGKAIEESPVDSKPDIHSGDLVRVQLDVELFKAMQEGHGGWNDQLVEVCVCVCVCVMYTSMLETLNVVMYVQLYIYKILTNYLKVCSQTSKL